MSGRHDILEIIGRPGAAVQTFVGEFLWRLISQTAEGVRRLWRQPYGVWVYLVMIFAVATIWSLPVFDWKSWLNTPEKLRDIVAVLAAPAAVITLVLLARRTKAIEQQVAVSESGLITERYSRAVESLGHEKRSVRIGAIYSLERLAIDSPSDHPTIMEMLAAYVRETAPSGKTPPKLPVDESPEEDIAATFTVISRRNRLFDTKGRVEGPHVDDIEDKTPLVDLTGVDLVQISLSGAALERIDFRGSHLTSAQLQRVNLEDCRFSGADLRVASLYGSNLTRIQGMGADLSDAFLNGTTLKSANLEMANLSRAVLWHADLTDAILFGADLSNANLTGSDFLGARLRLANFSGAELSKAKHLTQSQIDEIYFDPKNPPTNYPEGLSLPDMARKWSDSSWMIYPND